MNKISLFRLFWFILNKKNPVTEIDLLKNFVPGYNRVVRNGLTVELFHMHFHLYHHLYRLSDRLRSMPFYLHIENMFVYMIKRPAKGFCRHFDENRHIFCNVKTAGKTSGYCDEHGPMEALRIEQATAAAALRTYYLDASHNTPEEAKRIIGISKGMLKDDMKQKTADVPLGYHPTDLQYSIDRLERRYWHMANTYEDVCTGFIGDFTEFNRAYSILSKIPSDAGGN